MYPKKVSKKESQRLRERLSAAFRIAMDKKNVGKKRGRGHFKRTMTVLTAAAAGFPLSGTILLGRPQISDTIIFGLACRLELT